MLAPRGIGITTWFLAGRPPLCFDIWNDLALQAEMVNVGTIVYGWFITVAEGGIRVAFWAIKESGNKLAGVRAEGRTEGRTEQNKVWRAWIDRREAARDKGEDFNEPPPDRSN